MKVAQCSCSNTGLCVNDKENGVCGLSYTADKAKHKTDINVLCTVYYYIMQ